MKLIETNHSLISPILALHGTASTGRQWDPLGACSFGARRVYSPNLPGYGDCPNVTKEGLSARLQPLLKDFLQMQHPMHIVGHSFGGALALRLAEMHPEKCLSLTIYEPTSLHIFRSAKGKKDMQLFTEIQTLANSVSIATPMNAMNYFIDFWMGKGKWHKLSYAAQQKLCVYAKTTAQDFRDALFEVQYESELPIYSGSVKVLFGEKTMDIAKHICQKLACAMPKATATQLPELGHMGPIQNPDKVNSEIMLHIQNVENS